MFLGNLLKFQENYVNQLLNKCKNFDEIILSAPTGSGKTVMMTKFIVEYLDENPNTVFIWLSPGAGGLEKQSLKTFSRFTQGNSYGDVYSFISEPEPEGSTFFINWDKINKKSNLVLREGEYKDLMSQVKYCQNKNIEIFLIIDEEHTNKDTANQYIANILPTHTIRISATPTTKGDHTIEIKDDEVINAGLIASGISINEDLSETIEENNSLDDDLLLIDLAEKKRKEILEAYRSKGKEINPLVLIQFPNGSEEWITRIKGKLNKMGFNEKNKNLTSWFSGNHPNHPDELQKLDGTYSYLLFKQAIATGWDCPRAKILVKLREGGTENFNIQTIGRIRRMPERVSYDNEILDYCYLYTLDREFKQGLTNSLSDSFYTYQYERKNLNLNIKLNKLYLNGEDRFAINPELVVKALKNQFYIRYNMNETEEINKTHLKRDGFIFTTKLTTEVLAGVAKTTHDITKLNKVFAGAHEIDNHLDGFIIRDAKRKIAKAIGIDENISNNALKVLFGPIDDKFSLLSYKEKIFEKDNKLIMNMSLNEYNAFLINNRDKIIEVLQDIKPEVIGQLEETEILNTTWEIPKYQYYKRHKKIKSTKIMSKNVFKNYEDNILLPPNRSQSEIAFEEWCENNSNIEWVYTNGDKGLDYFSIVYRKAFRRNNFYPDYIIALKNGDIWIIEAKGGIKRDGSSNNVDPYAKVKLDALQDYIKKYPNLKCGFVRAVGNQILITNTVWSDDLTNTNIWKSIDDIINC